MRGEWVVCRAWLHAQSICHPCVTVRLLEHGGGGELSQQPAVQHARGRIHGIVLQRHYSLYTGQLVKLRRRSNWEEASSATTRQPYSAFVLPY